MRPTSRKRPSPAGEPAAPAAYQVPALVRGLQIVEHLAALPAGATLSEIIAALGLPKPSVFRLLQTLAELGYVQRDAVGGRYRLSRKLLTLGYAAVEAGGLVEKSLDVLRALRDDTGETALLAVLAGHEGIVLEQVASPHAVKVLVQVGHRFPLHSAAPGKAILACLPEAERAALLATLDLQRFTARTITTRAGLDAELAEVRRSGVAYDRGEELDDLRCVGAAVLDARGLPLAAIWVTGPASRLSEQRLAGFAPQVAAHARTLSQRFS